MTTQVYLGLGSNIDRVRHLRAGLDALARELGPLALSPVYESAAVGFDGDPFFNLVVGLKTDWPLPSLASFLKAVEVANGRTPASAGLAAKTLDIDILTYGTLTGIHGGVSLPRGEILRHAFVLRPLAELAGHERHPLCGRSYGDLWESFTGDRALQLVPFSWSAIQ